MQKALDIGVTLFAGEIEGRFSQLLTDAFYNKLQSIYNFLDDLPSLEATAIPILRLFLISWGSHYMQYIRSYEYTNKHRKIND